MRIRISGQDVEFLIFANADIDADIYFQYLQMRIWMWILEIMRISADADVNIRPPLAFKMNGNI